MTTLDYAEMGILKRRHGITVTRQVEGVAYVITEAGDRRQYAIEHLKRIAGRTWKDRITDWIAGVTA